MMPQGMTYDYRILRQYDWDDLQKETQDLLNEGFQLVGPPQRFDDAVHGEMLIQCMILPKMPEQQDTTPIEEPNEEEVQTALDERATQHIMDSVAEYTKDLMDINDLSIRVEKGLVNLYKKNKNMGAISGSALLNEIKHGKHAPIDLDESRIMNELDTAIVVGLQVDKVRVPENENK